MCCDTPDMTGANQAALMGAQLSREQLDWVKQIYGETAGQRADTQARQNAVSDQQLESSKLQDQLTREQADNWRTNFKPLDTYLAKDALAYDTPARRDQMSGQAMADVDTQTGLAREATMRDMAARGVDPSSGAAAIALERGAIAEGGQRAAAGNQARLNVETIGHGRLMDAVGAGRNVITNQGTTAGIALTAGNSAGANSSGANATGMSGAPMMQQSYGTAINGLNSSANTIGSLGKIETDASNASMGALGSAAGGFIAIAV